MWRRVRRPRVLIYSAVLVLIVAAVFTSIALRKPFKVDVVRDRASLARLVEDGRIENLYRLQVMNATEATQRYRLRVDGRPGLAIGSRPDFTVDPADARWVAVRVQLPPEGASGLAPGAHPIHFMIDRLEAGETSPVTVTEKSTFVLPR